jgi:hypothetical protein
MRDESAQSIYERLSRIADGLADGTREAAVAGPESRRAIAQAVALFAAGKISRGEMNAIDAAGTRATEAIKRVLRAKLGR